MAYEKSTPMDPLDVAIAALRSRRDQIDAAIAAMEAVRSAGAIGAPTASCDAREADPQPGEFLGMTIADAAKKLLAARRKPLATREITSALIEGGIVVATATLGNTVGSVLYREAKKGEDLVSVGRGMWALAGWNNNPSRSQTKRASEKVTEDELLEDAVNALDASNQHPGSSPSDGSPRSPNAKREARPREP